MKIYKYETGFNNKIKITELEAEEKNKIYVIKDRYTNSRILKTEIGVLSAFDRMYLLERDDDRYINSVIDKIERVIEANEERNKRYKKVIAELKEQKRGDAGK